MPEASLLVVPYKNWKCPYTSCPNIINENLNSKNINIGQKILNELFIKIFYYK
jgi:hypothetical protein